MKAPSYNHFAVTSIADTPSMLSGTLATMLACTATLVSGVMKHWPLWQTGAYLLVGACMVALTVLPMMPLAPARWLCHTPAAFVLVGGVVALVLQALSGEPFLQPIIFTVLFVHAALLYIGQTEQILAIGALYLGLLGLGIWLGGEHNISGILVPIGAYGALFGFMYAFTTLSANQTIARRHADALAADLARERDYLARLVELNALVASNLDLANVLEHVAQAGYSLSQASRAQVWLRDANAETGMRLAATVPANATEPLEHYTTLSLPLVFGNEAIGMLTLDRATEQPIGEFDQQQLQPFANAAAIAIRNASLYEQARMSATLSERNRLARELHDTIAQGLTAINMQLEAAQRSFDRDTERTRSRIQRAAELSREALGDVRRSVWALAAPSVESANLAATINDMCSRFSEQAGIRASYQHHGPEPSIDETAATQVLRIIQEALHNVEKHAQASHVLVVSHADAAGFHLSISDDGVGFATPTPQANSGFGLIGLRERARIAGGTLEINSAPGEGTRVIFEVTAAE